MRMTDYRHICPRCNDRYGVRHPQGWVDITVCATCEKKKPEARYADGKINMKKYRGPHELPLLPRTDDGRSKTLEAFLFKPMQGKL